MDYISIVNYTSYPRKAPRKQPAPVAVGSGTPVERQLPDDLIWPKQFKSAERVTASKMCVQQLQMLDVETVQLLLDEVAGTVNLRSPLGLLRSLIERSNQGEFYPSMAYRVQEARRLRERLAKLSESGSSACTQQLGPTTPEVVKASIGAIRNILRRH